jgi:tetratricopeptide (TPR) repeat protein
LGASEGSLNGRANERERLDEALRKCEQAIAQKPDHAEAYNARGNVLRALRRFKEAVESYDKAIALKPDYADAYSNRGNALQGLRRLEDAIESYDKAIASRPDDAAAYNNRGTALKSLRRFDEALSSYDSAIAHLPDRAELHNNRGNVLRELDRLDEAIAGYDTAVALRPDFAEAYSNRAVALTELKRFDEALASFDRALTLKPDHPEAIFNRAHLYLLTGQFAIGWRAHQARKRTKLESRQRWLGKPLWLGDADISGKTILVDSRDGLGDVIQFSRYIRLLKNAGARVLFAAPKELRTLMRGLDVEVQIVNRDSDTLLFDFHCDPMSLPLAFKTDITTIPSESYISADQQKIAMWRRRLGDKTRPRIGVVWRGSAIVANRDIEFGQFQQLFDPRFEFISLQKHVTDKERAGLNRADVFHAGDAFIDYSDTAALCTLMDLVISVDTSVAHLAGALGMPVWVLLRWVPDWRWLLDREDSPWYPSMRLLRQNTRGDWDELLRRVALELRLKYA